MRTTVNLNDELLEDAKWLTGIEGTTKLVNAALKALVEREAARRLARMGGTMPDLEDIPRRRSEPA
jgi:Arc/MetJ family transcription regulator